MAETKDFNEMFKRLKEILEPYAPLSTVVSDKDDSYYLDTKFIQDNKKPLFFASVLVKKSYVSFYLMPIYLKPELVAGIPDNLKKNLKGKSCFNFKSLDDDKLAALSELTKTSMDYYKDSGYIQG